MPNDPLYIKRITPKQGVSVIDSRTPQGGDPLKQITPEFRAELIGSLNAAAANTGIVSSRSPFFPMRILLEENATAKTHRPDYLFAPGLAPIIGAGKPGELFVQASVAAVSTIKQTISTNRSKALEKAISTIRAITPMTPKDRLNGAKAEDILRAAPSSRSNGKRLLQIQLFGYADDDDNNDKRTAFNELIAKNKIQGRHPDYSKDPDLLIVETDTADQIEFLANLSMVRRVEFLPCFAPIYAATFNRVAMQTGLDVGRAAPEDCPIVAVVDTGIDDAVTQLRPWIAGRERFVAEAEYEPDHGTFVGGLIVWGDKLNPELKHLEALPCRLLDVQVLPNKPDATGKRPVCNAEEFFESLEAAVKKHPEVKVWNLSLSSQLRTDLGNFSQEAKQLDDLQERYGISIVIAAGNYPDSPGKDRLPFPRDDIDKDHGRITTPGDTVLGMTVGAVAHTDHAQGVKAGEPSPFSRNGPGPNYIIKPDLAQYGGNTSIRGRLQPLGLTSTTIGNALADDVGTSFATPLVSRQLAYVYATVNPAPSPVTARAILTHSARDVRPATAGGRVADKEDHFLGFGVPLRIRDTLECHPWMMTMVFEESVVNRYRLEWDDFPYPSCLMVDGKYVGEIWMTLAYNPARNTQWGSEYCETHVSAHFGTIEVKDGKEHFTGRVPVEHTNKRELYETFQVKNLRKWAPVRTYYDCFPNGIAGDRWKLWVDLISRHGRQQPQPFTLLLTIADPEKRRPVYNDMTVKLAQKLQTQNLSLRPQLRNRLRS